jgi:hypothetical protein
VEAMIGRIITVSTREAVSSPDPVPTGPFSHGISTPTSSLFRFRDWAVHPPADFRQPVLHPDLQVGVDQRFLAFSSLNADRAVLCGLEVIVRA